MDRTPDDRRGRQADLRRYGRRADGDERAVEAALRPRTLDEVIGQDRVREQLGLVLEAARAAAGRPTTCCSPVRPGSARPRWR